MRYLPLLYIIISPLCWGNDITEDYYFEDLPVVLSVSRIEQPLVESTSSVTIIDHEMINASGARDIPELLRLVPGFIVAYANGNTPVATYHGFGQESARHLQVLINGRPIYSPLFSGVFWADLPFGVDDIERIEVIRGPNSALYGSNSFNAVISITTKQAASSNKSSVHTKIGNNNFTETYFNQSLLGDDWDYSITLSRKTDDGFDNVNDGQVSNKLYTTYNYKTSPENTLTLEAGYINGQRQIGIDDSLDIERNTDIENYFARLQWEKNNSAGDLLSIQYIYDKNTSDDIFSADIPLRDIPGAVDSGLFNDNQLDSIAGTINNIDFSYFTVRQEIELTYQPHTSEKNQYRYIVGFSTRQDQQNIRQLFSRTRPLSIEQHRVFYNGEYRKNNWLFNLGIMFEDNEITGLDNMPKFSAMYLIDDEQSIRYTYSRASRSPVGLEEFADYRLTLTPNPDNDPLVQALLGTSDRVFQIWLSSGNLDRETIQSNEIAYQSHSIKNRYYFNAKVFSNQIDNLISGSPPSVRDFTNTDSVEIQGLEISLDKRFTHYRLAGSYSKLSSKGQDIGDQYTQSIPDDIFSLYALYNKNNITLSSTLNHYSDIRMLDTSSVGSFTYLNLFFKYQSSDLKKRWLSISANKLLDEDFEYRRENQVEKLFDIKIGFDF